MEKSRINSHIQEGANALSKINDKFKTADYVERAADRAERRGEKMGNSEQRIGEYLLRLEKITKTKDGERRRQGERRIKEATLDALTVKIDEIPDSYWTQQEELARENGKIVELDDKLKRGLHEHIVNDQRRSAEKWIDYLDNEGNYPTWFKVFALDGMSQMGIFDKNKRIFRKRSQGTVAPYPNLNPAVLAKTYDVVSRHYIDGEALKDEESVVKGGNFNKIYSRFLIGETRNLRAPENFEDVKGEWHQYLPGQEEELMAAAQGTPWCIAGETMANAYLQDDGQSFYLFHLEDPDTGVISGAANASIRMEDGEVAEISGIEQGSNQVLEDSLVPIVEEKVKTLPGGEAYLEYLEEAKYLKKIDNLAREGKIAEMSDDEMDYMLNFVFDNGHDYKIHNDDRMENFRDISYLISLDIPAEKLFEIDSYPEKRVKKYLECGIPAEKVLKKDRHPFRNIKEYLKYGGPAEELFEIDPAPEYHIKEYFEHDFPTEKIFEKDRFPERRIEEYLECGGPAEKLFEIDERPHDRVEKYLERRVPAEKVFAIDFFPHARIGKYVKYGMSIEKIFSKDDFVEKHIEEYVKYGIPIEKIVKRSMYPLRDLDTYQKYGLSKEDVERIKWGY